MLQARLQKRLWKLEMSSFDDYCDYLFSHEGMENELQHMINVVTTNKTEFFREPKHFEYLTEQVLPELIQKKGFSDTFMVWCAGCSTGEEPYSLAMVLNEFAERNRDFRFLILATDISSKVLEHAKLGIYEEERIESVPMNLRKKYVLRSKSSENGLVRIVPELRARIRFRRLNFMDRTFGLRELMDMVFCRNVIIYFDRPTQEGVLTRICNHLRPGGYLFTGHSETLNGMKLPLTPVSHTVYRHIDAYATEKQELPIIYLKPAEICITDKPSVVRTVLGSCLAITMFHPSGIAAICHALLPEPDQHDAKEDAPFNPLKYVTLVIPEMIAKLKEYGIKIEELEVKMFGGADMLTSREDLGKNQAVGRLNSRKALMVLESHGLKVRVSDVGGTLGRKIFFYTHTGEVLLKRLASGIFPQETI
jgi:chemotaxis protein methyltransferase CheR